MERSGGEVASKRACSATGKDRISALPDELLLHILLFLRNAADAARTSVLSRRWRTVWTLLEDLRVPFFPEPRSFRRALTASQLRLRYLDFSGVGATPESLGIWLPAAARRLHGTLVLTNHAPEGGSDGDKEEEEKRARKMHWFDKALEMPCFDKAAKIGLDLGFLRLFVPPSAVFTKLTVLILQRVHYVGPFMLGDVVSSPRCPCLQILRVCDSRGLFELTINSESLLELELRNVEILWELTVDAAVLKELTVVNSFRDAPSDMLVATISAPRLESLYWRDLHVQRSIKLGPMPHLQSIGELSYFVYGPQGPNGTPQNSAFMKLLQPFQAIETLFMSLAYVREIGDYQYMMEDMKVLPNPAVLYLYVFANGHSFGASSFHVLRLCVGIKRLVLVLLDNVKPKAITPCLPGCVCDEQQNWKTEELLLMNLQEIAVLDFSGSEHEVSFVKRLLNWATALNKMTVTLRSSITGSTAKELFQMLKSFSRPGVCIEMMCHNRGKGFPYAPQRKRGVSYP